MKELIQIQQELKAPKNQKNSFGGYNYRSCEDILEAVKPLIHAAGCDMIIDDRIIAVEGRVYVEATVKLMNQDGKHICVSASARESETKKGMDAAQITGAASSYARKYALNGLFLIDDTKDADATNTHGKDEKPTRKLPEVNLKGLCEAKGREFIKGFSSAQACIDELKKSRTVNEDAAVVITEIFDSEGA